MTDLLPRRSLAVLLASLAIALCSHVQHAPAQPAPSWSAPHQVTKLQWLAMVVQIDRRDGFCRAPVCRVRTRLDVLGAATALGTLEVEVDGFNATQEELRHETSGVIHDIRYAAHTLFDIPPPPVKLHEVRKSTFKGIVKVHSDVRYRCELPRFEFADDTGLKHFNFDRGCTVTK